MDFLTNDHTQLSVLPIEVKSGKDYYIHRALDTFVDGDRYPVRRGMVFSNEKEVTTVGNVTHYPIYYVMFL